VRGARERETLPQWSSFGCPYQADGRPAPPRPPEPTTPPPIGRQGWLPSRVAGYARVRGAAQTAAENRTGVRGNAVISLLPKAAGPLRAQQGRSAETREKRREKRESERAADGQRQREHRERSDGGCWTGRGLAGGWRCLELVALAVVAAHRRSTNSVLAAVATAAAAAAALLLVVVRLVVGCLPPSRCLLLGAAIASSLCLLAPL